MNQIKYFNFQLFELLLCAIYCSIAISFFEKKGPIKEREKSLLTKNAMDIENLKLNKSYLAFPWN